MDFAQPAVAWAESGTQQGYPMAKNLVNQAHSDPGHWVHTPSEVEICLDKYVNTQIRFRQDAIAKLSSHVYLFPSV
jgi:hypothetical protein